MGLPYPLKGSSMSLFPREAHNLLHSRFSSMLIPFSMFSLDSDYAKSNTHADMDGEAKWRFCWVAIFNQECCQSKDRPKKPSMDTFLLKIGDLTQSALFWWAYPTPFTGSSMSLLKREAQNLPHSRFSCMLIPFSMFSLDSDQGKVKYSPLYWRGSKVTILGGRHFNQECCKSKERRKKRSWDTFLLEIGYLTISALFWWAYRTPLKGSSMSLLPREAQNVLHSRFSCMLIPFSMFSLDSDQGKVKYSPLYWRGSKVTILGGRHFNQECCQSKERRKKRSWDTFLLEIGYLTISALFWWAYRTPLKGSSMSLLPREAQNLLHTRFSCMLIPFSMFSLDSDQCKVKYTPLYGRESKVTILLGRHFQSGMLPIERASKKT